MACTLLARIAVGLLATQMARMVHGHDMLTCRKASAKETYGMGFVQHGMTRTSVETSHSLLFDSGCLADMSRWCEDKIRDSVHPNPCTKDCSGYISCGDGYTYELACPTGLVFNPATGKCDWPRFYQCPGVEQDDSDLIPAGECRDDMSTFCKDKPRDTLWANACLKDCSGYISCGDGYTYELACPTGLVYNANKKRCDYPDSFLCSHM